MDKKFWLRAGLMGLILAAILFSVIRALRQSNASTPLWNMIGETIELSGTIRGDPDIAGSASSAKLEDLHYNGEVITGTVFLYGRLNSDLERGDRVTVYGKLSEGFGVFIGAFYQPKVTVLLKPEPRNLALTIRNSFAANVTDAIDEREARLGLAYLLGMRNGLDDETIDLLSLIGLTHIVVASGTHLGIIVDFLRKRFEKVSRFAGLLFSLICIFIFGEIVGWTASITRAAIVSGLTLFGWYYGRKLGAGRVILVAIAITLMINPMYLFDIGWQLSFASFAGIMVLEPMLVEFFYGRKKSKQKIAKRPNLVAELVLTSIAATLMCMPILVYNFGSISLISILANILILPTIPLTMGLIGLIGIVGYLPNIFLFDWISSLLIKISTLLLDYHLFIMELCAKQTNLIIHIGEKDPWIYLLYIPVLLPFAVMLAKRTNTQRRATLRVHSNPEKYLPFTI
ncbi:ComEC/Rec2 family competence protein [Candidatus Saccharibacteria bacterium]|nr:ComEC/Rec2 family competence protein [Candidatus Saccharibacteria bacterium]